MTKRLLISLTAAAFLSLSACGGGTSGGAGAVSNSIPDASQDRAAGSDAFADSLGPDAPKIIYVGFGHAALKSSKYGPVAFYAPTTGKTAVISVKANSKVEFENDDTTRHTASGLGDSGFPASFDNTSGINQVGKTINSSKTWDTGSLAPNEKSIAFTVGPKGVYYFGCYYHYHVTPAMRNVIVSN
jgi:plastocyanin